MFCLGWICILKLNGTTTASHKLLCCCCTNTYCNMNYYKRVGNWQYKDLFYLHLKTGKVCGRLAWWQSSARPKLQTCKNTFLKIDLGEHHELMSNQNYAKNIQATKPVIFFSPSQEHWDCEGSRWRSATVRYLTSFYLFIFLIVILNQKVAKSQIFSLGNGRFWWRK